MKHELRTDSAAVQKRDGVHLLERVEDALRARLALEASTGAPLAYRLTLIDALLAAGATGEARDVLELAEGAFPGAVELRERRNQL